MRHNKNFNHLGRQAGHRKAMLSNMATSLILHKRIETTVAKAKAVQRFVEPLVTKTGFRLGDAADMCIIEFVDFNEPYTLGIAPAAASEAKPKTRRSRKSAAKATDAVEEATVVEGEAKKAAPKKAAAPKKPAAPKAASAKAAAPKVAKKTNVGKKM